MRLEALALPMVRLALTEDVGGGDVTTDAIVDPAARARAHIESKQEGVLSGSAVAALAFQELDPGVLVSSNSSPVELSSIPCLRKIPFTINPKKAR